MTGYAKSKYNDLVVGYGLDANDGEDGLRMVMELILVCNGCSTPIIAKF